MLFILVLAIIVSKAAIVFLRMIRYGGTSMPGKIALLIYPGILKELSKPFKIIAITGTNGKTTTSRIIGQVLKENGIGYITNKSGANMLNGIITSFIEAVNIKGKSSVSTALFEIDEAAFNKIVEHFEPHVIVVTNFFRDQLDRYGEVYSSLNSVLSGIRKTPGSTLVLNADDSLCASLGRESGNRVIYYGFSSTAWGCMENTVNNDATFCLYCKTGYDYKNHVYGHLGGFVCRKCGYRRPESTVTCIGIDELNENYTAVKLDLNGTIVDASVNLPAIYNIYNALAGCACGIAMGFSYDSIIKALNTFECGFGRMETIKIGDKIIRIILIKNPTGFNQVLDYVLNENKEFNISFLINDNAADGRDISWLWDVNIEKLEKIYDKIIAAYVSGTRGLDMAVRLKYADFDTKKIKHIEGYNRLIDEAQETTPENCTFYILPTYTAMLDIRSVLKNKFKLKEFWE
jgi:UDP-N-acetylmuramyl tripeptide synthase